jgi:hypothetical protein
VHDETVCRGLYEITFDPDIRFDPLHPDPAAKLKNRSRIAPS